MHITRLPSLAALAVAGALAAPAIAGAATLNVCDGGCQYQTIQAAVDAAAGYDTISVEPGRYHDNVTIPPGKDGLTLKGAKAGVRADPAGARPPVNGQESFLSGSAAGNAITVRSSGVTVDGFTIHDSRVGVFASSTTSGLRVVNTMFTANGNSIVPDSNGAHPTVLQHNAFVDSAQQSGIWPGKAILTGSSRGRMIVADNRIAGFGSLLLVADGSARDVTVVRNRAESGAGAIVQLQGVEHAVIEDNVVNSTTDSYLAWLNGTSDVVLRANAVLGTGPKQGVDLYGGVGPNRGTLIEANNFGGAQDMTAIIARSGGVADTVVARYNRFAPGTRGLDAQGESRVDARYNWWGCNEGDGASCARWDKSAAAGVSHYPHLKMSLDVDSRRIENASGGTMKFRTSFLRDVAGGLHQPARFPRLVTSVGFSTGSQVTYDAWVPGVSFWTLTAKGARGADLIAKSDNATVRAHIDFGPAPASAAPKGDDGAQGAAGPAGPAAAPITAAPVVVAPAGKTNPCTASARGLSCMLPAGVARASKKRGVKATLSRAGRRVAVGSVRVMGGKVQLRIARRVPAGRYDLMLTRGARKVARVAVVVTA